MELQITEVKIPKVIEFINFEEIKNEVAAKVERYANVVYTEDQIKEAKADRAKLRKFVDALETKRKEIKKECLAPYEAFEKQMKEVVAIVNEPIAMIDGQVKNYEEAKKADKRMAIEDFWIELSTDGKVPEGIKLEQIFNDRWLNATASFNGICAEIEERLNLINQDLATLAEMPEFAFEAIEVYKNTLNINIAIGEGKKLVEMQKRKAEAQAQAEAPVAPPTAPEKPVENVNKQWVSFRAYLSTDDALALKEFFTNRNIEFEAIR